MGILDCSNKGPGPFQRGDNHKNAKIGWGDSHTIFNEQNKCKASTEIVRIILSTCLQEMEK
jgi:hypothetical protein